MTALPWFQNGAFPLYLAPMAGITDVVFRQLCKEYGADVMVTEFVSAEGILQRDDRTRKYTDFTDSQRPLGIQLFGADGIRMGEAAKKIIEWKQPDFIDINFGCPVNKVVSRNGGSSLLKDCPTLASVASGVAKALQHTTVPVTAKIRIGWDSNSINAPQICHILQDCGIQAIAVHGRTRAQSYTGLADWEVIDACARSVTIPIIGNGDIQSGADIALRKKTTAVSGIMIGRAAMQKPWIFAQAKHYLTTGEILPEPTLEEIRSLMLRHATMAVESTRYGNERHAILHMRGRLMAYCKGFPGASRVRKMFTTVASLNDVKNVISSDWALPAEENLTSE